MSNTVLCTVPHPKIRDIRNLRFFKDGINIAFPLCTFDVGPLIFHEKDEPACGHIKSQWIAKMENEAGLVVEGTRRGTASAESDRRAMEPLFCEIHGEVCWHPPSDP